MHFIVLFFGNNIKYFFLVFDFGFINGYFRIQKFIID